MRCYLLIPTLVPLSALAAPPLTARILPAAGLQQPLCITYMPGDADHLYVVQRTGRIRTINLATEHTDPAPFLDLTSLVRVFGDGGLLGLAFDPAFATSGAFYVYFTRQPDSQGTLMRFHADPVTHVADASSGQLILTYPRNPGGHNGGWIGISPVNGYLYLSSGDGGTAANPDPVNASQTITGGQFQGKMLRLDVSGPDDFPENPDKNYRIPPDNPFVGIEGDDEIWDYGLRNAWRCSFDRATGDLWIADVGQDGYEEIDVEPAGDRGGHNYGWRCVEGPVCTSYSGCVCPFPSVPPYFSYDHTVGQSITGGVIYRGQAIPGLVGKYLFADFQLPRVFVLTPGAAPVFEDVSGDLEPGGGEILTNLAAIGEDQDGEVYMADFFNAVILCIEPDAAEPCIADFNQDGGVDGADVEAFFLSWEAGDPASDVNHDGGVDGGDVEFFFSRWEAGSC